MDERSPLTKHIRVRYEAFGKTRLVPLNLWKDGKPYVGRRETWDRTWWVERGEDWYGLMGFPGEVVLVVKREDWLRSPEA